MVRNMRKWVGLISLIALLSACHKDSLSEKAAGHFSRALKQRVEGRYASGVAKMQVRDRKVVYENDSICLMQCYVDVVDRAGKKELLEYRYIFLWDTSMSRLMGKKIYNEVLLDFPCLPDKQIELSLKEVERTGESVYESLYGETFPLKEK